MRGSVLNAGTSSALIEYDVNMTCVGDVIITEARVCSSQEDCARCDGSVVATSERATIASSSVQNEITGITSGVTYCYCAVIPLSNKNVTKCINSFTAMRPAPPSILQGAIVIEGTVGEDELPVYQCSNSLHGFNGGSSMTTASFDVQTQVYSLNESCSCKLPSLKWKPKYTHVISSHASV